MLTNPFRRYRCHVCFGDPFYLAQCDIAAGIDAAGAERVLSPSKGEHLGLLARTQVRSVTGRKMAEALAFRRCPHCKSELPDNIEYMQNQAIGLAGGSDSGKSHYIAALIKAFLHDNLTRCLGIREFNPANKCAREDYPVKYYGKLFIEQAQIDSNKPSLPSEYLQPLVYVMVFEKPRRLRPVRANLVLFDAAGEQVESAVGFAQYSRYTMNSAGLIVVIDPLTMPSLFRQLKQHHPQLVPNLHAKSASAVLDDLAKVIRKSLSLPEGEPVPTPVALALTKSDLLRGLFASESPKFLSPPDYRNGYDLRNDYPQVRDEVRELLEEYDSAGVFRAAEAFRQVGYFAVSGTGASPENGRFPKVEPLRCLDPLLWLLTQMPGLRDVVRFVPPR